MRPMTQRRTTFTRRWRRSGRDCAGSPRSVPRRLSSTACTIWSARSRRSRAPATARRAPTTAPVCRSRTTTTPARAATGERELAFVAAARAFFGVMFLPNSRQLHRALITSRKKLGTRGARLAETALLAETSAAIDDALAELKGNRDGRPTATVMRPATALASVNMVQPQGWAERRVLRGVAVRAASLIAAGKRRRPTGRVFFASREFSRPGLPLLASVRPGFRDGFFVSRPRRTKVMKPHYKTGITV